VPALELVLALVPEQALAPGLEPVLVPGLEPEPVLVLEPGLVWHRHPVLTPRSRLVP